MNRSERQRSARPGRMWILLIVVLLHLGLLGLWQRASRHPPSPAPASRVPPMLVWLRPAPPAAVPPDAAAPSVPRDEPRRLVPRRAAQTDAAAPSPGSQTVTAPTAGTPTPTPATADATAAAASAPGGSLLDTDASRRAIRDAARQRSIGELGAQASGEPAALSAQERLGQEMARGARGDCLKGEYAGAGMGLLSLPFWVIAELRDKCRR
jgi:hypothetical protein